MGKQGLKSVAKCQGGFVDDFLSHLMCCCCALVQEWREVEIRGVYGMLVLLPSHTTLLHCKEDTSLIISELT